MSTSVLDDQAGVRAQLAIWGYAITGDVCETGARVAENQYPGERHWDRTAADLAGQMIARAGQPARRVKDFAALPWVTEHVMRGRPGL